ncbi:MAG: porin [Thiobacillus sp.]|nr:porin [Thiobacillus sp.]MDP2056915.1 porin [Thiobacillus sp.]
MKKILAMAIASAFAAPAFAATANVDVGGYMNFSVDYLDSDNAANGGNVGISSNASNIFFKGAEDLGGGLKAIWQVQTFFSAGGTGNNDGSLGGVADGVGSGNTYVGLAGGFGTVLVGKNESPVKMLSRKVDLFGNQIGDNRNLTNDTGWDLRPNNQIAYTTPNMSGFSGTVAYFSNLGPNEGGVAGPSIDATVDGWAAAANYANGPLMLGLGYETHNLSNFNAALEDERVWRLNGGYTFGNAKLVGFYQKADDRDGVNGSDRTVWGLGGAYMMGNINLKAQYYKAGDANDVDNTGADMWALGADYSLSKRTMLQLAYAETDNDSGASLSVFGGGHGDNPGTSVGGNPNGFSVGVVHTF